MDKHNHDKNRSPEHVKQGFELAPQYFCWYVHAENKKKFTHTSAWIGKDSCRYSLQVAWGYRANSPGTAITVPLSSILCLAVIGDDDDADEDDSYCHSNLELTWKSTATDKFYWIKHTWQYRIFTKFLHPLKCMKDLDRNSHTYDKTDECTQPEKTLDGQNF